MDGFNWFLHRLSLQLSASLGTSNTAPAAGEALMLAVNDWD